MFAVPLEQIALSNRERAFCKRADLINSAQLLFAQPDDSPAVRTLFESTQFDLIREEAARVQAPESTSILTALVSADCNLEEECFASGDDDEREGRAIISPSSKALGKRKSLTSGVTRRKATNLSDPFTLTSGDREIDALLGGGWRRGCLTEIVGESSSGKSQLGMQTVLYTTLGLTTFRGDEEEENCPTCSVRRALNHDDKDNDDLFRALQGCGVQNASSRGSVAILNSGGRGKGDMIVRRLLQLCNTHIEQRWNAKQGLDVCECRKSRRKTEAHKAAGLFQKKDESSANSLQEVQLMAKGVLLSNLHLLSPKDYDSLEHAVTYTLPALAERLASQGQPRLSLVIVDDLPDMLIEEEGENVNHSSFTLRRSRMVGEIADRLKRLAVFSPLPDSSTSPLTAMALIVMNQVVDSFKANEDLLWPMLQQQADVLDEYASQTGPPPLTSAYQDAYFNGALASVDIATFLSSKQRLAEQMHGLADQDSFIPDAISSSTKIAALGHSWVNCINVRIMLSKTKKVVAMPSFSGTRSTRTIVRRAVSVLNPFAEAGQGWRPHVEYVLCAQGVRALSDVLLMQQSGNVASAASIPDEDQLWSSLDVDLDTADLDGVLADQEKRGLEGGDSDSDSDGEWWKSIADSDIAECGSRF